MARFFVDMYRESGKSERFGPYESAKAARDARARLHSEAQYLADPFEYGDVV